MRPSVCYKPDVDRWASEHEELIASYVYQWFDGGWMEDPLRYTGIGGLILYAIEH